MASKKGFFEQKIKEAAPGYKKGVQLPVGQREWNPTSNGSTGGKYSRQCTISLTFQSSSAR